MASKHFCTASALAIAGMYSFSSVAAFGQVAAADAVVTDPVNALDDASGDGEIIVTAQRRAERQVDVPITVTTLGSEQLETANVEDLSDISRLTPSLRFDYGGAFAQPTIRGIGTSVTTSGGGANVGIYIDGFYSPNPLAADSQLMNVQSIQVLKGPQGTLFGRNTTGGAILIQTSEPSEEPAAQFKTSYARFNDFKAQGYATVGVAPGVSFDVEGLYRRGDNFQRNIIPTGPQDLGFETWSIRAGLKVHFSDDVSLLVRYMHGDADDPTALLSNTYVDPVLGAASPNFVPSSLTTTDPNRVALDRPTFFKSVSNTVQATVKADLGFADLTSYTQHRSEDVDLSQDLDNSGQTVFQIAIPVDNETFSQEFLLTSKPGSRLEWQAGLFYFSNRDTYQTYLDNFGPSRVPNGPTRLGGSNTTTKSYAAFLNATYEVVPQLFVTLGGRYAHDVVGDANYVVGPGTSGNAGVVQTNPIPSISSNTFTPRVVLRYKPSERSSIYASFAKGYKAAIIDAGGSCQNPVNYPTPANPTGAGYTCNPVQPESIDAYEIGFKYSDRRLSAELSAFYYDYKNLQVSLYLAGRANIINAANSKIYGVEGSLRYEIVDGLEVNAGASWTHARYTRFVDAPIYLRCPTIAGCGGGTSFFASPVTLNDATMQRTPEFTGNLGARYKTELAGGELQLSGNLYYTSEFFFGPSGLQFSGGDYEILSARAQWTDRSDRFSVAVFGDNLTNSRYLTAVQYNSFGLGANWSAPTTYGIELGVKF